MRRMLQRFASVLVALTILSAGSVARAADYIDLGTFGSQGSGPGQLSGPNGLAVGDDGSIYIADTYNLRVNKYTSTGAFILSWGSPGSANGQFQFPYGIDVNDAGEVFVGDLSRGDVQVFDSGGAYLRRFGSGILSQPFGLSVDDAGSVFVTDRPTARVFKFSTAGTHLSTFGPSLGGQSFSQPQNVDCLGASEILVSDGGTLRIQKLTSAGALIQSLGIGVLSNPTGTATSGTRLFVTEYSTNRVSVIDMTSGAVDAVLGDNEPYNFNVPFDAAVIGDSILLVLEAGGARVRRLYIGDGDPPSGGGGEFVFAGTFGSSGSGLGQLAGPDGIAVSDDGKVYVADTYNSRVQWFDHVGNPLGQFGGTSPGDLNMSRPYGVDVDAAGDVYVSDFGTLLVKKFTGDGTFLGLIGDSATFAQPLGLWVSDEGTVFVTDRVVSRVRLFSATTGAPTGVWGPTIGPITLSQPQNIEGDGCGLFYLSDGFAAFQLRVLDGVGLHLSSGPSPLDGNPTGSALAGSRLFLTEYNTNALSVIDLVSNSVLEVLGDNEPFTLNSPIDATTMGDSMLYVLDTGHNRVVRVRLPVLTPPSVQVQHPNGGEVVLYPAPLLITWSASDDVDVVSVDLLISRDGGVSWGAIATNQPNTGQYEWVVTGPASDHCLVRVIARDAAGGVGKDRSDLEFALVGLPVPTLLVSLFAEEQPDGIAVQWQLADAQLQSASRLQRSLARDGAYSNIEGTPEVRADGHRLVDRSIESGRTYWYRVVAGEQRFGPIPVESGASVRELAFAPPSPNPTAGASRFAFALPRSADVDLTILDVSGREVVRLVSGERPAGRHEITWTGEDDRGRVVPGLYFARLAVQGEPVRVQRVVLTR